MSSKFYLLVGDVSYGTTMLLPVTSLNVGVFQTLESVSENTILIRDQLYGEHTINEPILVELLRSPTVLRLTGICQYGVTALLGFTPRVTRFEHSVGALLLVRKVGASLEEQVAALPGPDHGPGDLRPGRGPAVGRWRG